MANLTKFWKKDLGISRRFKTVRERSLYALTFAHLMGLLVCLACIYSLIDWYTNRKKWFVKETNQDNVIDIEYKEVK